MVGRSSFSLEGTSHSEGEEEEEDTVVDEEDDREAELTREGDSLEASIAEEDVGMRGKNICAVSGGNGNKIFDGTKKKCENQYMGSTTGWKEKREKEKEREKEREQDSETTSQDTLRLLTSIPQRAPSQRATAGATPAEIAPKYGRYWHDSIDQV